MLYVAQGRQGRPHKAGERVGGMMRMVLGYDNVNRPEERRGRVTVWAPWRGS